MSTPVLALMSDGFQRLPATLQQQQLHSNQKVVFIRELVLQDTESICLLMQNLHNHMVPNTLTFKENAIWWYRSLLLDQANVDNMALIIAS